MNICPSCNKENSEGNRFCSKCGCNFCDEPTGQLTRDTLLGNRYIILKTLGQGGMGAVYLALDTRLDNVPVAIKEMSTRAVGGNLQAAIAAFKKEADMLSNLEHPQLPRLFDLFSGRGGHWYLVMDYLEGQTLQEVAESRGPIPEEEVLNWGRQLCEILDFLHRQTPPIVFRDLKPANIMLTPEGRIILIDFGIARYFEVESSGDTCDYGFNGFASPEQFGIKQVDTRSDIYALGAILHYLLTGQDPVKKPFVFEAPSQTVKISPHLEAAIMKALEMQAENRPESMREMLDLLSCETAGAASRDILDANNAVPKLNLENTDAADITDFKAYKTNKTIIAACLLITLISLVWYGLGYSRKDIASSGPGKEVSQQVIMKADKKADSDDTKPKILPDDLVPENNSEQAINHAENETIAGIEKEKILFNDFTFENAVREAIIKPEGDIYIYDVKDLRELDLHEKGIADISGIQYLTNLQILDLGFNNISDISALQGLVNLQDLNLGFNNITDISALKDLKNLQKLGLNTNRITDISPLRSLSKLDSLCLPCNQVSDITALQGLTNLVILEINNTGISDINKLQKLTSLKTLYLNENHISDIRALQGLTNLQILKLDFNNISDISALRDLTKLEELGLFGNQISDYSPVKAYYGNLKNPSFEL